MKNPYTSAVNYVANAEDPSAQNKVSFILMLLAFGIALLIASTSWFGNVLSCIAGAFIGASVSALCGFLTAERGISRHEMVSAIEDAITTSYPNRPPLDMGHISSLKHFYWHTSDAKRSFWMHAILEDYTQLSPYRARADLLLNKGTITHEYMLDLFVSEPNLILRMKSSDPAEKTSLDVIVDYCMRLNREEKGYFGIKFHLNWSKQDRVNPSFVTYQPVDKADALGEQSVEAGAKLMEYWLDLAGGNMRDFNILLK